MSRRGKVIDNPDRLDAARGLSLLIDHYSRDPTGRASPEARLLPDLRALFHFTMEGCQGLAIERADGPLPVQLTTVRDLWRRTAAARGRR